LSLERRNFSSSSHSASSSSRAAARQNASSDWLRTAGSDDVIMVVSFPAMMPQRSQEFDMICRRMA